jgi:putative transposase
MPWKETCVLNEKTKFIARLLEGERMTHLCDEYGISRKTGYKIWNRYQNVGHQAFVDRPRTPHRFSNQLPEQIERAILKLKKEKPLFGAPKIRELIARRFPGLKVPAVSTIHAVLDRNGLVQPRKRRRYRAEGTPLSQSIKPNDLWCTDFKGEFMLGDRRYCYPLTITDHATRYLFAVEALDSVKEVGAFPVFERVFQEYGLPLAIRSDNGVPFATANGLFGLSKLSVWWLRLGIQIERIKPGHPEQNGRHERMHLTLKKATAFPAGKNFLEQQDKFEFFQKEYNEERPHQALKMKFPSELYQSSDRVYRGIGRLDYPLHHQVITVTQCGRICFKGLKISLSHVFAGQDIGIRQIDDRAWLVSFMNYDLGYFDEDSGRFEPGANPFGSKVLPLSP